MVQNILGNNCVRLMNNNLPSMMVAKVVTTYKPITECYTCGKLDPTHDHHGTSPAYSLQLGTVMLHVSL